MLLRAVRHTPSRRRKWWKPLRHSKRRFDRSKTAARSGSATCADKWKQSRPEGAMLNETVLHRWLGRVIAVRPGEVRALCWSFTYFFCLLAGYYVLRPLRDEMGVAGGVRNLQWLFTATFLVMRAVVAPLPRRRFIPVVYRFFIVNLAIFWLLLSFDVGRLHVARVFFVWISVFSLFAVSVFWSFMADLFT